MFGTVGTHELALAYPLDVCLAWHVCPFRPMPTFIYEYDQQKSEGVYSTYPPAGYSICAIRFVKSKNFGLAQFVLYLSTFSEIYLSDAQ